MNLKKTKLIILFGIIIIFIIMLFTINNNMVKKHLEIKMPIKMYNKSMSNYRGFPLKLECNNNKKVIIKINYGILISNDGTQIKKTKDDHYDFFCNQTIFWNNFNKDDEINNNEVIINIKLLNEKNIKRDIILFKNEKYEYHLISNK